MIRLVRTFVMNWRNYPMFKGFWSQRQEQLEKLRAEGEYIFKNRLDYAVRNTAIWWKHRDQYSRKCMKNGGDCEHCNAKHC